MKMNKKLKKGFTLVELVVVIAVIAILAAVSVGAYFGVTESAKNSQALQEGKALHTNMLLVANDPANTASAEFSEKGIKVTTLAGDDVVTSFEYAVEKAANVDYTWEKATEAKDQTYPFVEVKDTDTTPDGYYDTFTYHLDEGHEVTFDIVTGAQNN